MNDRDDQVPSFDDAAFDDPALDDPAFDDLRALLADARVTEPIPADVAARLEATLSSLRAELVTPATVVPLRRRLAPILVAAAAAVVVVAGGVGIAQVVRDDSASHTMSADSAASSDAGGSRSGPAAPSVPESAAGQSPGAAAKGDGPAALASLPAFTTARFAEQVAGLDVAELGSPTAGDTAGRSPAPTDGATHPGSTGAQAAACTGPALPDSETVPILLDGRTAVLVLHRVSTGKQVVDAWSCDGTQRLATATVPR